MADRLTMMPLFQAMLDFDSSPETYEKYDRMSALELFKQYGVSKRRAPARAHAPKSPVQQAIKDPTGICSEMLHRWS